MEVLDQKTLWKSFFSQIFATPELLHPFPKEQFRNKITYTLGSKFSLSNLAPPELNNICQDLQNFRNLNLDNFDFNRECFNEVTVLRCRTGEILLKLVFIFETEKDKGIWSNIIGQELTNYIIEKHQEIKTIVCQWSKGKSKSKKGENYEIVYGLGYVNEITSTGASYCLGMLLIP
jgi:hypothetical protein